MRIAVLGAGAWGTALASSAARENKRYLAGVPLAAALQVTSDTHAALDHGATGLYVVATPMSALRETLGLLPQGAEVVWLCKGFEAGTGLLGHEVAAEVGVGARAGVLSGPSFAIEVARGQPTALVAASAAAAVADDCVSAFHGDNLRVYTSTDPIGVEVGGAVKNVLAIATGVCDGVGLGLNARAALITRGLAEMTRLGIALGARADTFMGLSGLGDLILTATGDLSRNRQVGLRLAQGVPLATILSDLGHVAEGVHTAQTVVERARRLGVEMPISEGVLALLRGELSAREAGRRLMAREARPESPRA